MTRDELLVRHDEISLQISLKHGSLGHLLPDERRIKVETFLQAQGSDKVRQNAADQASLHVTEQVLRIQSEIKALEIELENVRMQLHYS